MQLWELQFTIGDGITKSFWENVVPLQGLRLDIELLSWILLSLLSALTGAIMQHAIFCL